MKVWTMIVSIEKNIYPLSSLVCSWHIPHSFWKTGFTYLYCSTMLPELECKTLIHAVSTFLKPHFLIFKYTGTQIRIWLHLRYHIYYKLTKYRRTINTKTTSFLVIKQNPTHKKCNHLAYINMSTGQKRPHSSPRIKRTFKQKRSPVLHNNHYILPRKHPTSK